MIKTPFARFSQFFHTTETRFARFWGDFSHGQNALFSLKINFVSFYAIKSPC